MARQPVAGNARTDAPTATVQSVTASATVVTLLVANDDRLGAYIENDLILGVVRFPHAAPQTA